MTSELATSFAVPNKHVWKAYTSYSATKLLRQITPSLKSSVSGGDKNARSSQLA